MSLLEIKQLVGGYTKTPVLKGISFDIQPNELVGLIGLNGAGKSTTIKHIIGLMEPKGGRFRFMVKHLLRTRIHIENNSLMFQKRPFCMMSLHLRSI